MEGILESAARTTTLKPASAKAVPPFPEVQECSARGVIVLDRIKNRAASVRPASFTGNSGLKGSISV